MVEKFRETHLFAFLRQYDQGTQPLDAAFSNYLRSHKSIGAHDRRFLGDTIYSLMRWRALLDHLLGQQSIWEKRYNLWRKIDLSNLPQNLPPPIQCGAGPWLFQELAKSYGENRALELGRILNEPAPLTVRANLLKTNRDFLLERWKKLYDVEPCLMAKAGIRFRQRIALTTFPEFKEGLFEIQDEGSQLVADLIQPKKGEELLDYCSGSGGKSLAIAPSMAGRGQIYLHDIRAHILQEARRRLRRAGVQNAQFLPPGHPRLSSLKNKMDWVLADVPCSGSGTYRRNPDMKWKGSEEMMSRLIQDQREIFGQALSYARPGGKIVYATCSLFKRENEQQIEYFLNTFPIELAAPPLSIYPEPNGPDGFFGAVFCKQTEI
jgi:16S rRNA C967 or C1407 C5-methylase (RsmB/RsmF family)